MMDALPANATTAEMAAWLRVSERTLKRWRAQQPPVGPPFVRVDATVRYPLEAALAWLLDSPAEMVRAPHLHTVGRDDLSCMSQQDPVARDGLSHVPVARDGQFTSLIPAGGSR